MGLFNFGKTKEEIAVIKKEKAENKRIKNEERNAEIKANNDRLAAFRQDRDIEKQILIDSEKGQFKLKGFINSTIVYDIADINGYELVENGETVTSGGLGRAAVGALAFGGFGAIVGAVTGQKQTKSIIDNLKIKINMNNLDAPVIYINLITTKTKASSMTYKLAINQADNIVASLDILVKQYQNETPINNTIEPSTTGQLREYKSLLDDGIITQEEFDLKKKELLK